jgi:hypothetical protein
MALLLLPKKDDGIQKTKNNRDLGEQNRGDGILQLQAYSDASVYERF